MIPHLSIEQALSIPVNGTTLVVILTALPLILAAFGNMMVTIRNGGKADANAKDAKSALEKSGEVRDGKLETIHGLVNSEMTKALTKIDEQRAEINAGIVTISELKREIMDLKEQILKVKP